VGFYVNGEPVMGGKSMGFIEKFEAECDGSPGVEPLTQVKKMCQAVVGATQREAFDSLFIGRGWKVLRGKTYCPSCWERMKDEFEANSAPKLKVIPPDLKRFHLYSVTFAGNKTQALVGDSKHFIEARWSEVEVTGEVTRPGETIRELFCFDARTHLRFFLSTRALEVLIERGLASL
jgi:hypothetical protein